jgi:thiamine pyrophosphate-dependent acetolactate synthase large subunit-like protein
LVVATSSALREWVTVSQLRDLDIDLKDCVNFAPAVALGLSLAQPDRKVLVLDCDTNLRAGLSGLVTVGMAKPNNLVHFVFDDVNRRSTSGLPIRGLDQLNFLAMAREAGYPKTFQFDTLEVFLIALEDIIVQPGPVFVLVKVVRDFEPPAFPARSMAESWNEVSQRLQRGG